VASKSVSGGLAGSITITASASSLTFGTTTFTIVAGAADHLAFTSSAADLASGTARTLRVEIRDAGGNLETSDNTTRVTFAETSGTGTVSGLGTATAAGGIASRTVTGAVAGSITITASAASLTAGSTTLSVVAGTADHLTFTGSTGDLASGNTRTLTVEIRDAGGNLVTSDNTTSVTFAKTSGLGTLTGLG